jgi:glutamate-ammonia-ligase adenylyltransferase
VTPLAETVNRLLAQLPDPRTSQLLFDQLVTERESLERTFQRDPALLSDVLTLAAWSPLLATTLENNPDYVMWLQRERVVTRVRTGEELGESLGRFALINSQLDPHVMLARFRRRELLRTYLHDIRRTRTIVETTDELSSLADAVLEYALKLCRQELDNRYGSPQTIDAQSRISSAEFGVMALGKLGSGELNYASDIDLVFLFSDEGATSHHGSRAQISNREYFIKLAERLLRLVGAPTGEGASYRIDARLRPHGREGALACSVREAVSYYQSAAEDWELQALIRARSAAGSAKLFSRFAQLTEDRVYRSNISVAKALANVRTAKNKIDRQRERDEKGYNVKLGRGGIREIEFIAQALQLAFGGDDPWLRTPHTLVTLGRLSERSLISEREHSQLSDAYHFLRALEHRLQMEHGLQTHSVPLEQTRRETVARRMSFSGAGALEDFENALETHTRYVSAVFDRVFGRDQASELPVPRPAAIDHSIADTIAESAQTAAVILSQKTSGREHAESSISRTSALIEQELRACANPTRAMSFTNRIAAALEKDDDANAINEEQLKALIHLCDASEFFGEMIASRPSLIHALPVSAETVSARDYQRELMDEIANENTFGAELTALRLKWSQLLIQIAAHDAAGALDLSQVNRLLTDLAKATVNASLLIARRELERRYGLLATDPRIAVLALGRFGSGGMDYGSDLDLVIVYDAAPHLLVRDLTQEEAYARLTEYFVTTLSSITREGLLYRVDLRLRPDGQKGPLATSSAAFITYIEKRAGIWEWLAYVKLRSVAGELGFARRFETSARRRIHELAQQVEAGHLLAETRRVRDRLQKDKVSRRRSGLNIKHGAGGMLDVYFAGRYLQLRDNVPDDGEERRTPQILQRLRDSTSIDEENFEKMFTGYALLRSVDHQLRLIIGRSSTVPSRESAAFADMARRLGYKTADQLEKDLTVRMKEIRQAYDTIMSVE